MTIRKKQFLMEGQLMITTVPVEIITILGSCVSVCLYDKRQQIAGINHYLMPGSLEDEAGNAHKGHGAIRMLVKSMLNRKCEIGDLQAKVFGGSNSINKEDTKFDIGRRNIEVALELLKESNIPVVASHTGGVYGRKIIFNTGTGKVLMRLLKKTAIQLNEEINKGFGV
jgi:chemotaxis protein CheD